MSLIDFDSMAAELERIAAQLRSKPDLNHNFANRVEALAKEIRREALRAVDSKKTG